MPVMPRSGTEGADETAEAPSKPQPFRRLLSKVLNFAI